MNRVCTLFDGVLSILFIYVDGSGIYQVDREFQYAVSSISQIIFSIDDSKIRRYSYPFPAETVTINK